MADLGNIAFGIEVRGERDIAKAVSSLDNMQKKLAQVALAERKGAVASGTLAKSTKQLQNALARQTGDLIGATKAANSYRRQLEAMTDAQLASTVGMQGSLKGFRNVELFAQQAGYQIGDFAVQVQSGTNPLVAFSQQASQLLGFMGTWGAVIGAAAAITGGIAMAFLNARDSAKSFQDQLSETQSALDSARQASDLLELSIGELRDIYGTVNEELREFIELQTEARQLAAMQETLRIFESLREELTGLFSTETMSLQRMFNVNQGQANALAREFNEITEATTLEGQIQEVIQLRELILDTTDGVENMTQEQRDFYLSVVEAEDVLRRAAGQTKEIAENLDRAAFNFNQIGGLNPRDPTGLAGEGAAIAVQQQRIEELRRQWQEYQDSLKENETTARRSIVRPNQEIAESIKEINDLSKSMANSFAKAFTSMVDGTKSAKDAFKDMARAIISDLYQIFVVKRITGFITGALQNAFTGGLAPATSPVPTPAPRASGGMMSPNQPYLVGERGPELVMPNRQSTVMNADLTAKALGGGESINVTQVFNINGNGDEYIMGKIAQAAPRIADATKKSILDERRRGGVYKSVFG